MPTVFELEVEYAPCANSVPRSLNECGTEEMVGDTVACERHNLISVLGNLWKCLPD